MRSVSGPTIGSAFTPISAICFMIGFALMRLISIYAGNEFTKTDLSLLVAELTLASAGCWLIKNRE